MNTGTKTILTCVRRSSALKETDSSLDELFVLSVLQDHIKELQSRERSL